MRRRFLLVIALVILLPTLAWCSDLFVQSRMAPVFKNPSLDSMKLTVLARGTKVTKVRKRGMWQQIQYDKQTGWVYSLMLSETIPLSYFDTTVEQMDKMAQSARKRPSSYTSTAAARGLVNQRKRLAQKLGYDYAALEKMESYAVDEKATLQFIKEKVIE
jgi:hypothetical protein